MHNPQVQGGFAMPAVRLSRHTILAILELGRVKYVSLIDAVETCPLLAIRERNCQRAFPICVTFRNSTQILVIFRDRLTGTLD